MTLNELIEELEDIRDELGGHLIVESPEDGREVKRVVVNTFKAGLGTNYRYLTIE